MDARQYRLGYRGDIEGLRAVAILLVVAAHAKVSWLAGGFVGVDVFFVLSGYLITGVLLREISKTGRVRFGAFYDGCCQYRLHSVVQRRVSLAEES